MLGSNLLFKFCVAVLKSNTILHMFPYKKLLTIFGMSSYMYVFHICMSSLYICMYIHICVRTYVFLMYVFVCMYVLKRTKHKENSSKIMHSCSPVGTVYIYRNVYFDTSLYTSSLVANYFWMTEYGMCGIHIA